MSSSSTESSSSTSTSSLVIVEAYLEVPRDTAVHIAALKLQQQLLLQAQAVHNLDETVMSRLIINN